MTALKLQAFSYAEMISPTIHDGVTIGPASGCDQPRSKEPIFAEEYSDKKNGGETGYDDSQWDQSQLNQSSLLDTTVESNVQHVVQNLYIGEMEKLRREMISREMKRRLDAKRRDEEQYRERITAEAAANLEEKSNILRQVYAAKLEKALRELREREQTFAEEDSRRLREIAKRREARKDVLKRQADNLKTHQCLDSIRVAQMAIGNCYKQYCATVSGLDTEMRREMKEMFDGQFQAIFDSTAEILKSGNISALEVKKWHDGHQSVEELLRSVEAQILLRKERIAVTAVAVTAAQSNAQPKAVQMPLESRGTPDRAVTSLQEPDSSEFISSQAQVIYSDVERFCSEYEAQFRHLQQDAAFKEFKKRANFAVNPILSIISPTNIDIPLGKLNTLLSGAPYIASNNTKTPPFQAGAHPQGIAHCKILIAKQFLEIDKGTDLLSSYASVFVTLSHRYPDLAKLFRWLMYQKFPLMVPFNIPQYNDQTTEEYRMKLGYIGDENTKQYIERVALKIRFYAAIIASPPKSGEVNPFGLNEGWRWLVDVLNREPFELWTALIIQNFLEVAAARLFEVYGRQFLKLLSVLERVYLPKCVRMDQELDGSASRAVNLGIFIEQFRKRVVK